MDKYSENLSKASSLQEYKQIKKDFEFGEAAGQAMIDALKTLGNENVFGGFVSALIREHRTNQQIAIKNLVKVLVAYSKVGTDDRNKAAVDFAIKVKEMVDEKGIYFPLI